MYLFHTSVKSDTPGQPSVDVDGKAMDWNKKRKMRLALHPSPHPRPTQRQHHTARGAAGCRSWGILHKGRARPQ